MPPFDEEPPPLPSGFLRVIPLGGVGDIGTAVGALGVLGMNVLMMALGASGTLAVQRTLNRRVAARRRRAPP